jgi:hypothetical protein
MRAWCKGKKWERVCDIDKIENNTFNRLEKRQRSGDVARLVRTSAVGRKKVN